MGKVNQSNPRGRVNQIKEPPFPNEVVLSERANLDGKHASSKGVLAFQDYGKGAVVQTKRENTPIRPVIKS